ncbi:MAG TPA: Fic family protein [Pseudobdellovibrionaceae bacterium]|nr:Fic family protein [Pseudobdellovibrionaceae bacterium]
MSLSQMRQSEIIVLLQKSQSGMTSSEIFTRLSKKIKTSEITLKRDLANLVLKGLVLRQGKARATQYLLSPLYEVVMDIDPSTYFLVDVDQRPSFLKFQFNIFEKIKSLQVFSSAELEKLKDLAVEHQVQKSQLSSSMIKREYERLTIELSWKSSAIEGNTYSLLETETLLKEGLGAKGKRPEETQMLLNHKATIEYFRQQASDYKKLSVQKIEEIHKLLVKDLDVPVSIRKRMVAITGTKYRPLDNEFQTREALGSACLFINSRKSVFEKAFWAILLISYIQPFEDGNKRTSRMVSTALLLSENLVPLSYRSVNINDYKQAILLFYERNNISVFKRIFIEQVEFATHNYFRATPPVGT